MTLESAVSGTLAPHGTPRRHRQGCHCAPCRAARIRYEKERLNDALAGRPRKVDATGSRRRLQALVAVGWTYPQIGARIGRTPGSVYHWAIGDRDVILAATARMISAVYDELSMKLPPERTRVEKRNAAYARTVARRHGWPSPLAWDDDTIDDPRAKPRKGPKQSPSAIDEAAVLRLVEEGKRVKHLSHDEAQLAYDLLRERGFSDRRIEDDYGLKAERYEKRRPILADAEDEWESAS